MQQNRSQHLISNRELERNMNRGMVGIFLLALLFSVTFAGISSGSAINVVGGSGGSDGSGSIPTINPRPASWPSPRDPIQYDPPNIPIIPDPSDSSNESEGIDFIETSSPTIQFSMTSNVTGTSRGGPARGAAFSQWSCLQDNDGSLRAKKTSSALYGSIDEARQIVFLSDIQETSTEYLNTALMLSRDQVRFSGSSYRERVNYLNEGDLVRPSFESSNISKDSTYISWFENYSMMDDSNETGHLRMSTLYNLDLKNAGITNLDLISRSENSSQEIVTSQQYIGDIAIRLNFKNTVNRTFNREKDDWLPCCYGRFPDTYWQNRKYSNISDIFDCKCGSP